MFDKYLNFCDTQTNNRAFWFIVPLVTISAIAMPIGASILAYSSWLIAYIALSILSFYANILASIAQFPIRSIIHTYVFTIAFHVIVLLAQLILLSA